MIGLFRQKYPDVSVQLQVHSTRRTGWSVANGQIDLAIIGGELPAELNELLQVVPYASDELALVLPVKHPLARLAELTKEDLYRLGFVCLDASPPREKWWTNCWRVPDSTCSVCASKWNSIRWRRSRMLCKPDLGRPLFRWCRLSASWRPARFTAPWWQTCRCAGN